MTSQGETEVVLFSTLSILQLIKEAQQAHGLRHGDYLRYRYEFCLLNASLLWKRSIKLSNRNPLSNSHLLRIEARSSIRKFVRTGYCFFRQYCARKLRRLRKALRFVHKHRSVPKSKSAAAGGGKRGGGKKRAGGGRNFQARKVTLDVVNDVKWVPPFLLLFFHTFCQFVTISSTHSAGYFIPG